MENRDQLLGKIVSRIEDTEAFVKKAPAVREVVLARGLAKPYGVTELPFIFDEAASLYVPSGIFYEGMKIVHGYDQRVCDLIERLQDGEYLRDDIHNFSLTERAYPELQLSFKYFLNLDQTAGFTTWTANRVDRGEGYWMNVVEHMSKDGKRELNG